MEKPEICEIKISFKQLNGNNSCEISSIVPLEIASDLISHLINWEKENLMPVEYARAYFKEEEKLKNKKDA